MRTLLLLSAFFLPAVSFAEAGVSLKPNPLTCVGVQEETGSPLVLDVRFTDEAGKIGSRISHNEGRAGRQTIEGAGALTLVPGSNPRIEVAEAGKYSLVLSGGEIERIASEQAAGTLGGDYSYRIAGRWELGAKSYPVDCEVKFVK
ncbi:MAG: hypothetical protein EOP11_10725 [Proteobacteria bacterium]|nr:MAG: hypothetical protein EOP11_10725 [Pseudomonadota bacterium]